MNPFQHEELEKNLVCQSCLQRLTTPISSCSGGHSICSKCFEKGIRRCPKCGERITCYTNEGMNHIAAAFRFLCKFSKSGCSYRSKSDELILHEEKCEFKDMYCMLLKNGEFCHEFISVQDYALHVQTYHHYSSFESQFKLNHTYELRLPKRVNLERNHFSFRIFQDNERRICFVESIYYDDQHKAYQISVHYIGKRVDASNYIYTIDVKGPIIKEYRYSNECLPSMPAMEAGRFNPFLLNDRNKMFSEHNTLKYNLMIQKKETFDSLVNSKIRFGGVTANTV